MASSLVSYIIQSAETCLNEFKYDEALAGFSQAVQRLTARGADRYIECTGDLLDIVDAWFEDVKADRVDSSDFVLKQATKVLKRIGQVLVSMKDVDPEDALGFSEKVIQAGRICVYI